MRLFILILVLCLSIHPMVADEYTDLATNVIYTYKPGSPNAIVKCGDRLDWDNGTTEYISGNPNARGDVRILDQFTVKGEEYVVNAVGDFAFVMNIDITSVFLPSTIETIGNESFRGCKLLRTLTLSEGLKTIGHRCFCGCASLSSLTLPDGLEKIGFESFLVTNITSFIIPSTMREIDYWAFNTNAVSSIVSKIEDPFVVHDLCDFSKVSPTLFVPVGKKEKYTATEGWDKFKVIEEIGEYDLTCAPSIRFFDNGGQATTHDLQGRRLASPPVKGVFIRDGKKVVK